MKTMKQIKVLNGRGKGATYEVVRSGKDVNGSPTWIVTNPNVGYILKAYAEVIK